MEKLFATIPSERAVLRRALLVGINYKSLADKGMYLNGCVNDAKNIYSYLVRTATEIGVTHEAPLHVCVLCDEPFEIKNSVAGVHVLPERNLPTRANIQRGLQWLTNGATESSKLFFSFSGHGTNLPDAVNGGDEIDAKDECLVPLDFETEGMIKDDDLRARVVNSLPRGAQLFCLIDACHSASMFDLRVQIQDISTLKPSARTSTAPLAGKNTGLADRPFLKSQWRRTQKRTVVDEKVACAADVVMLSGCRDPQTSADAQIGASYNGALSHALLRALNAEPNASLFDLLQHASIWLRLSGYTQQPILSFSSEETENKLADSQRFRFL